MKDVLKKIWNARFPIHNRFTTGLGIICLLIAVALIIRLYLEHVA